MGLVHGPNSTDPLSAQRPAAWGATQSALSPGPSLPLSLSQPRRGGHWKNQTARVWGRGGPCECDPVWGVSPHPDLAHPTLFQP